MAKSARARSTCAAGALSERLRRVSSWRSSAVSGRRGSFRWRDMAHLGARGSPHTIPVPTADDPLDDPAHAPELSVSRAIDGDHGRIETREASLCTQIDWLQKRHHWPGLAAIGKVARTREINGKTSAPLPAAQFSAVV